MDPDDLAKLNQLLASLRREICRQLLIKVMWDRMLTGRAGTISR